MSVVATQRPDPRSTLRLLPRTLLILIAVLVVGFAAIITTVRWHDVQAAWYCYRIRTASTHDEAVTWAYELWNEPARTAKLRVAVSQMGRGSGELDYTLMKYVMWPEHNELHAGIRGWDESSQKSKLREIKDYLDVLLEEVQTRPELLDLYVHRTRHHLHRVGFDRAYELGGSADIFPEDYGIELDPEWEPTISRVMAFAVQCRLSGRDDLIHGLNTDNWRARASEWKSWIESNLGFLKFDESVARCVLDEQAKAAGKKLPDQAHWVTASSTRLPGWSPRPGWTKY